MRLCMTSFAILLALIAFSPTQTMAKEPGGGSHGGNGPGGGHGGGEGGNHSNAVHVGGGGQGGHPVGVGGGAGVNPTVRSNPSGPGHQGAGVNPAVRSNPSGPGGQAAMSHQGFDARTRPEFTGGGREGRDSWRYRWDDGRWLFWGADNRWMWYGDDGRWQNYGNAYVVQRPILENFAGGPIKIENPVTNKETLSYTLDGNSYTIPPGHSQEFSEDRAWVVQFSRGANLGQAQYGLQSGLYSFTSTDHGWELYRSEFPQTVAPPPPPPMPSRTAPSSQ